MIFAALSNSNSCFPALVVTLILLVRERVPVTYDFQLDNLFYEEENRSYSVIDFDDAVYSWYAHDIITALDDFLGDDMNLDNPQVKSFLKGYSSVVPLGDEDINQFTYFQRFMKLYRFAKLLR